MGLQALEMPLNRRGAFFGRSSSGAPKPRRWAALGLLSTGLVCPCHVLAGLVALVTGISALSPAAQDGVHAVYVPLAVLGGALLWRRR
jgi:MYXO-CTERM domain-containing protein